jgi:NADPH:quinone reductase-like Zn-dependent oxidoreductase
MRKLVIRAPGGLDRLEMVADVDPGLPGPGQIRVALHASSLNFHDYMVASQEGRAADGRIPLSDGAGVVEAVGAGVSEFAVGDHVVSTFFPEWLAGRPARPDFQRTPGDGIDGYARSCVITAATAFTRAPRGFSHAEAATLTTAGLTAWRALVVEGGIKAGDRVLLLGTGGVSIFALQIACMMGAQVAITSSSDAKLERARALGAAFCLNYREHADWGRHARDWTGGEGFDHVVEVGGAGTLPQSIEAVRMGGHIALIGVLAGGSGVVPTAAMMMKQARLQGIVVGSRAHQQDFVRALDDGRLRPVIDADYPLDRLGEAFRLEASGAHFGKITISW